MSTDRHAERDAIAAATQRLLAGCPQRSTGALAILQLAPEAGVNAGCYQLAAHQHRVAPPLADNVHPFRQRSVFGEGPYQAR
ncbi:MAG: hypothetical protein GEV12_07960 [Micromonosporaceae bacterium]|nr:hypothetical protein [Micromonosporaceae bacterium]